MCSMVHAYNFCRCPSYDLPVLKAYPDFKGALQLLTEHLGASISGLNLSLTYLVTSAAFPSSLVSGTSLFLPAILLSISSRFDIAFLFNRVEKNDIVSVLVYFKNLVQKTNPQGGRKEEKSFMSNKRLVLPIESARFAISQPKRKMEQSQSLDGYTVSSRSEGKKEQMPDDWQTKGSATAKLEAIIELLGDSDLSDYFAWYHCENCDTKVIKKDCGDITIEDYFQKQSIIHCNRCSSVYCSQLCRDRISDEGLHDSLCPFMNDDYESDCS